MSLLISAVVTFQLKLRLKIVTLYRVKTVRIVFASKSAFVYHAKGNLLDRIYSSRINVKEDVTLNLHIDFVALNVAIFSSALLRRDGLS